MKTSHFLALLKNDLRIVWAFFPLAIFFVYLNTTGFRRDQMFALRSNGGDVILFMLPYFAWSFLFENRNFGKETNIPSLASFEFMFTRAINRVSLFRVKTSLFLVLSALPLVMIWLYAFTAPAVRIELPYNGHREELKQFYLSHFDGAYLQEPDSGKNKDYLIKNYIVLPHGRADQAEGGFVFAFAYILVFQVILFAFTRWRWIPFAVFYLTLTFLPFTGMSRRTPSLYEINLAWIMQHTLLTF